MDKKMLKALMGGEKDEMSSKKLAAKLDVIKELLEMADSSEAEGLMGGMQKVTVAAPDKDGLQKGLEKAEEVLEQAPEDPMAEMMPEEMMMMEEDEEEEDEEEDEDE